VTFFSLLVLLSKAKCRFEFMFDRVSSVNLTKYLSQMRFWGEERTSLSATLLVLTVIVESSAHLFFSCFFTLLPTFTLGFKNNTWMTNIE